MVKGGEGIFLRLGRIETNSLEILSIGVQAPGLDPGVGEMFRSVGPTPGNRALFLRIALPPPRYVKSSPWPVVRPGGQGLRGQPKCRPLRP